MSVAKEFCGRQGYAAKKYAQAAVRRLVKADEEIGIDNCTYSVVFQYEEGENTNAIHKGNML
jgi:hypothetical protein